MSGIVLSASVRQNLLSLQSTASLLATTQNDLATGNKVNSALDNPTEFFTAQSLNNRASDIANLLDGIGNGIQVLQAANTGIFPFRDEIARGTLNNIPIVDSATVSTKTLILVDAADFVVVGGEAPRMEMSDQATLHMEDTAPLDLVDGAGTTAAPQRSLFQTDSLALRMIMPLNWVQRRAGTVAWTQSVTW